jgi:hypothetical protein
MSKAGCCGTLFQIILVIINFIFFVIGVAIFAIAAVVKWSGLLKDVTKELEDNIKNGTEYMEYLTIFFLVFGAVIIAISLTGMIGACCASRCFLIIYVLIISIIFVVHLGAFIAFLVFRSDFEKIVKDGITSFTDEILKENAEQFSNQVPAFESLSESQKDEIRQTCKVYREVVTFFKCCDFNSTTYKTYEKLCCESDAKGTCPNEIYSFINSYLIILPNSVIIAFEFILIAVVIYIIVKLGNHASRTRTSGMEMGYYKR